MLFITENVNKNVSNRTDSFYESKRPEQTNIIDGKDKNKYLA